jgi:nucleoside-diphosphate-sugar epimerase
MKILVTGANGFVGEHLVKRLLASGHELVCHDIAQGDLTLPGALETYTTDGIQHVFHLAGKTFVPDSWINPEEFYRVNFNGTLSVLEFCRKTGAKLTHISSYLYGTPDYLPIDEGHPLKAYNPYAHSKLIAENTCTYYAANFGLHCCIFRPFNIYGPGQPGHFLISEIINKANNPAFDAIEVMDLRPKRDYIFIDDLIDALLLSIEGPAGIFNLASGTSFSAAEIVGMIQRISQSNKVVRDSQNRRQNEVMDLYADISHAANTLGWSPKVSMAEGLTKAVRHYKNRLV